MFVTGVEKCVNTNTRSVLMIYKKNIYINIFKGIEFSCAAQKIYYTAKTLLI